MALGSLLSDYTVPYMNKTATNIEACLDNILFEFPLKLRTLVLIKEKEIFCSTALAFCNTKKKKRARLCLTKVRHSGM